jgi:hypothetical protein
MLDSISDSDSIHVKSATQIRTALNSINTLPLCLKLSLAHAWSHANSELPTTSPQNGHIASQTCGRGMAPTSLPSQRPISPSDPDRSPDEREQDGLVAPSGEPNPPDGRPNENDGTDEDEQDRDEGNDDEPSRPHVTT